MITATRERMATDLYDPESGMTATVRTIYPHEAQAMLDNGLKNRKISKAMVSKWAKVMASGRWMLNGEAIIFDEDTLIDGQHRLSACIASNFPFRALCVYLRNENAFRTLDQGKKRGGADILSIAGYTNSTNVASALAILVKIDRDGTISNGTGGTSRIYLSNEETEERVEQYPGLERSCAMAQKLYRSLKIKKSAIAALHYLLRRAENKNVDFDVYDSKCDSFMQGVFSGANLTENSPAFVYRNGLIKHMNDQTRTSTAYIIHAGVICWNNWVSGTPMSLIRLPKNGYIAKIKRP